MFSKTQYLVHFRENEGFSALMLEQQGTLHKFQSKFVLFHYYFYYFSFLIVTLNSKDLFVLKKKVVSYSRIQKWGTTEPFVEMIGCHFVLLTSFSLQVYTCCITQQLHPR